MDTYDRLVAGIDSSTQSCKVVIYNPTTHEIIRQGKAPHPPGTQVDPNEWLDACFLAIKNAGGLDDVSALSVGGQQHGLVCLDEDGEVIRPAILWNDTRSAKESSDLVSEKGADWWASNIHSVPVASFTVTKLRWMVDNEPDKAARIKAICLPHDWLTWKIRGTSNLDDLVTDRSEASGTGYWNENGYRYDILSLALRIDEDQAKGIILPKVFEPFMPVGKGNADMGWGHITIGPGCGDNAGAALGVGISEGEALLSIGTSGVISVISKDPTSDPSGLVTGFADATGNWLPLAATLNASRIIDAIANIIQADYNSFDDLALSVPDSGGLKLLPYFEGERTPNLPDSTATLSGMTLANSTRAHIARAGVEGLLKLMAGAIDAMRELKIPIKKVLLIGGGAKSKAVRGLAPTLLGLPVEIPEPAEYVAIGAAKQAFETIKNS